MARVKSMFRKAALNSIGDRLFTIFEGKLFHRGTTRLQKGFLAMSSLKDDRQCTAESRIGVTPDIA